MNNKDLPKALERLSEAHKNNPFNTEKTCACLDDDARRCYEKRYIGYTQENEIDMREAVCGCPCHNLDIDECDCYDCAERRIV